MVRAAQFVLVKSGKWPVSIYRWMYIHTVGYYSVLKNDKFDLFLRKKTDTSKP